jgi:hypothetical protein
MVGLPGSGLGGLFYILLILWMFVRQVRSGSAAPYSRRRMVALAWMSVTMVAVTSAAATVAAGIFGRLTTFADLVSPHDTTGRWALILGMMPFITLAGMLSALQVARLVVPRKSI